MLLVPHRVRGAPPAVSDGRIAEVGQQIEALGKQAGVETVRVSVTLAGVVV